MSELIEEFRQFLEWYRIVYADQLYLDGKLVQTAAPPEIAQPKTASNQKAPVNFASILDRFTPPLRDFYYQIKDCKRCPLGSTRQNFVFGAGNPQAKIMLIGEAPGRDEDEAGIPFVGKAGQLLDRMLAAIGLGRQDVFIANVLKCRPPQNRDPLADEIMKCESYLKKQLELISPKVIVALGRIAGQVLLKREDSLSNFRQQVLLYENIPLIVTYHPAALLRNSQWKSQAWEDLKRIKKVLKN